MTDLERMELALRRIIDNMTDTRGGAYWLALTLADELEKLNNQPSETDEEELESYR